MLKADLSGVTALITGASSGLGAHFARLLARSGASVLLAARRVAALEAIVAELKESGAQAQAIELDVSQPERVRACIQALPRLDVLVTRAVTPDRSAFNMLRAPSCDA